ncbi:peptidoglycan recognition protein 3-like [Bicyclus anynana]|uniref:Peptidoglycan recognition protein 3-like n=1 Tax=Bicyclus anynana TaxID=110368 RepID=A0ABM3LID2_BICAN|nr:peptidoglycan recognition protein 3-like [Bicyclus anynana]
MIQRTVLVLLAIFACGFSLPNPRILGNEYLYKEFNLITREAWSGRPARQPTRMVTPVDLVVIHHSYQPRACFNIRDCSAAMRSMQDVHQITNGWSDIGYNFAVGSDGNAYEGRGWDQVGAHAVGVNSRSIGIVLIGDWVSVVPPAIQMATTRKLIAFGVKLGYISPDYRIVGHRQVKPTECPGEALFQEISTWDRFSTVVYVGVQKPYPLYTREEWGAVPATDVQPLKTPVPYVIIHHTYIPEACNTTQQCKTAMKSMQNYHNSLDWGDIGYHFCVGSEGGAYEGRGWHNRGIHAGPANGLSVGICLIGDWRVEQPPQEMLDTTQSLISEGVLNGAISPSYKLQGHSQVMATECPGTALLNIISTWDHFTEEKFDINKQ